MIKHTYADDIESLFYVFIWIIVLYDGPLGREREGVGHENTLLSFWSEAASKNLETAKFAKFTFLVSKRSDLSTQIAPYFADLLPLAESWRSLLGHYVHEEASVPFDEVLKVFDDFLAQMPDSEKPPAMVSTLHGLLNLAPPSPPAAKTGTKTDTTTGANIKHNTVYTKRLRDEVRSMGNPPVPTKRFKAV